MCKCGIYSILILKIYFTLFAADEEKKKSQNEYNCSKALQTLNQ